MTDAIRCRCGYTKKGHCSQCESREERVTIGVALDGTIDDFWLLFVEATPLMLALLTAVALVILFSGCGVDDYDAGSPMTACGDAGETEEDAGDVDPCAERQALWCEQGCEGTPLFVRECAATAPHCDCP